MNATAKISESKPSKKLPAILIGIFILCVAGLSLFWLGFGESYLKNKVEQVLSTALGAEVRLGNLQTNILNHLQLDKVTISKGVGVDTTLIEAESFSLSYSLSSIFSRKLTLNEILLDSVTCQFSTDSSGHWIFSDLFESDPDGPPSKWVIQVERIELNEAQIRIVDKQLGLDIQLQKMALSTQTSGDQIDYQVTSLWDLSGDINQAAQISLSGSISDSGLLQHNLEINQEAFTFTWTGNINTGEPLLPIKGLATFDGNPQPLSSTLEKLVGSDLPLIAGNMGFTLNINGAVIDPEVKYSGSLDSVVVEDYPAISGGFGGSFTRALVVLDTFDLDIQNIPIQGSARLGFDSLSNFSVMLQLPELAVEKAIAGLYESNDAYSGSLQGHMDAHGSLAAMDELFLNADFNISQARWEKKPIPDTHLTLAVSEGFGTLTLLQGKNRLVAHASLDSLEDLRTDIQFHLPNLEPIVPFTPLVGLTGSISGGGSLKRIADSFSYNAKLKGQSLEYEGFNIDRADVQIRGVDEDWTIQEGLIEINDTDLSIFNRILGRTDLSGRASMSATITGNLDKMKGDIKARAYDVTLDTMRLDSTRLAITIEGQTVHLGLVELFYQNRRLAATGDADWGRRNMDLNLNSALLKSGKWMDQGRLGGHYHEVGESSSMNIHLEQFQLHQFQYLQSLVPTIHLAGLAGTISGDGTLQLASESYAYEANLNALALEYDGFKIDNIHLKVKGVDSDWIIQEGRIDIADADLFMLNKVIGRSDLGGRASLTGTIKGNLANMEGRIQAEAIDVAVDQFRIDSTRMDIAIHHQTIQIVLANLFYQDQKIAVTGNGDWGRLTAKLNLITSDKMSGQWQDQGQIDCFYEDNQGTTTLEILLDQFQLGQFQSSVALDFPVEGLVSGKVDLNFGQHLNTGKIDLNCQTLRIGTQVVDRLEMVGSMDSRLLKVDRLFLSAGDELLSLSLDLPIDGNNFSIRFEEKLKAKLSIQALNLSRAEEFLPDGFVLKGYLSTELDVSGSLAAPLVKGKLSLVTASLTTKDMPAIGLESVLVELKGRRIYLQELRGALGAYPLNLTGTMDTPYEDKYSLDLALDLESMGHANFSTKAQRGAVSTNLLMESINLEIFNCFLAKDQEMRGELNADLELLDPLGTPAFKGFVLLENGFLRMGKETPGLSQVSMKVNFSQKIVQIKALNGKLGNSTFNMVGNIKETGKQSYTIQSGLDIEGITALSLNGDFSTDTLNLKLLIPDINLSVLQPFMVGVSQLSGRLKGSLLVSGSPSFPDMKGSLLASGLQFDLPYLDPGFKEGEAAIEFTGKNILLDSFVLKQGAKGWVSAKGRLDIVENQYPAMNLVTRINQIKLNKAKVVKGSIDAATLSFVGDGEKYLLEGEVKLGTIIYHQTFKPQDLVKSALSSSQSSAPDPFLERTSLKIKLVDSDQIFVQNNLANIQLKPNLTLLGRLSSPIPTGRVKVEEGYILYLDRRFTVSSGTMDFQDMNKLEPIVDFHAQCELKSYQTRSNQSYLIFLDITGPAQTAQVGLRSEPALDRPNILALLTMGATLNELAQSNPEMDNAKLTKIISDRLADYSSQKISAYASDKLGAIMGLESVSIEGDLFNFGSSWGPQLVVSKKLGDKVTLTYSTAVGQATEQNVKLEYEITKSVAVEGQTDQKGRSGIDLKYGLKFK